jgi:DNA mismatch repair protein MutL
VKIQILSDEMASRIAAGEVVERPASVVKELIENSLDAGASEIFVALEKSGVASIRVTDNGEGMSPDDLYLAVERHATSKLKEDDDLFRIATMGFRGEALPSIGSIAKVELVTRMAQAETGHGLRVVGGKKEVVHAAPAAKGTTIEIRDIFFNTPARKKFLKSPATELSHICDVVNRMALANWQVHFRLQHDGRNVADYVAVKDAKDRLQQVLGRDIAQGLKPFSWRRDDLGVSGYLSAAPVSFPNTRYLYTFVNRRYVRDKVMTHAVLQGYDTLLMKGQYPAVVLFLEIPFADVDVNVHPAKYEVRFRRQSEVHEAVSQAVRQALKIEAREPSSHNPYTQPIRFGRVGEAPLPYFQPPAHPSAAATSWAPNAAVVSGQALAEPIRSQEYYQQGFFASLNVLGQILGCYLVCASSHGLTLIDQHAAHERIAFEKLRYQLACGKIEKQVLLVPQSVELSPGEMLLLEQKLSVLENYGFELEPFGPKSYAIITAPALLPEGDHTRVVKQMVAELAEVDATDRLRQHLEDRLATMACHSVIRANRQLEMSEMRALLHELDQIEFATQCPHGRPVLIEFSSEQLERMFKRIV